VIHRLQGNGALPEDPNPLVLHEPQLREVAAHVASAKASLDLERLDNDALVLIDCTNQLRAAGQSPFEAAMQAGQRRFRPVVITTLITFCGLMPIVLEKSFHAQFLVPLAVSLAFGVLASTGITLVLVPSL
jgi:Cu/Ag efflux pump CusA